MAVEPVYFDTSALVALADRADALHAKSVEVELAMQEQPVRVITSDWVLAEFLGACSDIRVRGAALAMTDRLRASIRASVLPATRATFSGALRLYRDRPDKEWSLVDCASILACQRLGVRRVFTHDRHFVQAGFQVLLA